MKEVLEIYREYINSTQESVKDLKAEIAAATLHVEFKKFEDNDYRPIRIQGQALKNDNVLQKFGRRREFFEAYEQQMQKVVCLPDDIIDTESNLKPHVLKSLLEPWCLTPLNFYKRSNLH